MGMKPIRRPKRILADPEGNISSFESVGVHTVKGRGKVFCVLLRHDTTRTRMAEWVGCQVLIDGRLVTVRGVETFCIEQQSEGTQVGLLT